MARHRWLGRAVVAGIAAVLLLPGAIDAVFVAPTAVFLYDANRNMQVTVGNSSDYPEEVRVEFKFGFVDTDSAGTPFVRMIEAPGSEFPSAADWLGAYPVRTRLAPGERQVVRVFARPPADLPDGEYWSRMIVTGRRGVQSIGGDSLIRAGLGLEMQLVTSVTFRKGTVTTGLALNNVVPSVYPDSLVVRADLDRTGNAAYLGTLTFDVLARDGSVVETWAQPLSVHVSVHRRFVLPMAPLAPGEYVLRVRAETSRSDIAAADLLPARSVQYSLPLIVE